MQVVNSPLTDNIIHCSPTVGGDQVLVIPARNVTKGKNPSECHRSLRERVQWRDSLPAITPKRIMLSSFRCNSADIGIHS